MTSSIEKAAHRLEQLRNAGVVNLSNQEFLKKDTDISDTMLSDIESAKNKFNNSTNIEISSRENRPVSNSFGFSRLFNAELSTHNCDRPISGN